MEKKYEQVEKIVEEAKRLGTRFSVDKTELIFLWTLRKKF